MAVAPKWPGREQPSCNGIFGRNCGEKGDSKRPVGVFEVNCNTAYNWSAYRTSCVHRLGDEREWDGLQKNGNQLANDHPAVSERMRIVAVDSRSICIDIITSCLAFQNNAQSNRHHRTFHAIFHHQHRHRNRHRHHRDRCAEELWALLCYVLFDYVRAKKSTHTHKRARARAPVLASHHATVFMFRCYGSMCIRLE